MAVLPVIPCGALAPMLFQGQGEPSAGRSRASWLRRVVPLLVMLLVMLLLVVLPARPGFALAEHQGGAVLFENHCAGCHLNGGNIIRRGKTLKLAALERQGVNSEQAIAAIAAAGIGQMGGYESVLGEEGVGAVAAWVWQQAQAGWPRG
ncbi:MULTISPECIES: c-type cytochrome [Aphanothece]|uniref:c-type cytochrome n=1 Tax=Aphanothece TaxID=1121 RepID=UPI003984DB34